MTQPPRITIVTPSYNQAQYLEQTIDSVLSQGYPNLEYIIIDGGSTDQSAEIIRRHERHLTYWVSERDRGQTHAINKGMERATGEIRAYLNSDDYYLPGAFQRVADTFSSHPDTDLLHGHCRFVDERGQKIGEHVGSITTYSEIVDLWGVWWKRRQFVQPEVFWSRRIAEQIGPFREDLHYVMDYEYWLRMLKAGGIVRRIEQELTAFRKTPVQKSTQSEKVAEELLKVVQPELWNEQSLIPKSLLRRMQGYWLYQSEFCPQADQSVALGESRLRRWLRLSYLVMRHPKLLIVPQFRWRLGIGKPKISTG